MVVLQPSLSVCAYESETAGVIVPISKFIIDIMNPYEYTHKSLICFTLKDEGAEKTDEGANLSDEGIKQSAISILRHI